MHWEIAAGLTVTFILICVITFALARFVTRHVGHRVAYALGGATLWVGAAVVIFPELLFG